MKKNLLILVMALVSAFTFAQTEILIDDFTGNTSSGIGNSAGVNGESGNATIDYENNQLKSSYSWAHADWYPRALWYTFDSYQDFSKLPFLYVRFMVTDNNNDTIPVRLDLFGDGAEKYNDTIRTQMETNANPWIVKASNGDWYEVASDFIANKRYACTYWNGGIPSTKVDSTKMKGFEAFAHFGDAVYNGVAGTLYIDIIKMVKDTAGTSSINTVLYGKENAFGLAVYPTPADYNVNVNSQNEISNLTIVNLTGKTVLSLNNLNVKKYKLDISSLNTGLYIMNVTDFNGNMVSKKFTIKR